LKWSYAKPSNNQKKYWDQQIELIFIAVGALTCLHDLEALYQSLPNY
jgi:hypothetical protein